MNIYTIIILTTLVIEFVLNLTANLLNLRALSGKLPAEFREVYKPARYKKAQEYTRVNTHFGFITSGFNLIILLVFWFTGGFQALDKIVRAWGLNDIWTGLIYIATLMFMRFLISLPFSVYDTFVIEERFGFNKTTAATFIKDILKGLFLSIILGGPLLIGVLALLDTGPLAWLFCWGATTIFTLFVQFIAPTWIMPLFNKFTPMEDGELKDTIMSYTRKVKYKLAGIFIMDGSRRSSKSNAFFTGFGKNKRIALFDTLIEKHSVKEMLAILAHEIGHYKKKHVLIGMLISILHMGVIFFLLSLFLTRKPLFDAFYMENMSNYAGLLFFGLLYSPVELILSIFMNIMSRKHENQADRFAAETTKDPASMIGALKQLSEHNLSNLTPHPFYVFLNYSHPPVLQRIRRLKEYA